jgi:hypothetical protein
VVDGPAARRILVEQTPQHRLQRTGQAGRPRRLLDDGPHGLERVAPVERRSALHGRVERHPEREQVARRAERSADGSFGADEVGRAQHHAGRGELALGRQPGHAEVGEDASPVVADQHIGRLDVAMEHAGGVGHLERTQHRDTDLGHGPGAERPVIDHHVGEAAGLQ